MKLHLPKSLFIAVLAACACGWQASALQISDCTVEWNKSNYLEIGNVDSSSSDGSIVYDAETGIITGLTAEGVYFDIKQSSLTAEDSEIIYVTTDENESWGFSTAADGNGTVTGYWDERAWGNKGAVSSITLSGMANKDGSVSVYANISQNGTYLYNPDNQAKLYNGSDLLTKRGNITTLTVNKDHVSRVYYNVNASVTELDTVTASNASGTWVKTYDKTEVYYPTGADTLPSDKQYKATIITDVTLGKDSLDYTNLSTYGGDLIVGGYGRLMLQTYSRGPISLDNDIYLASRNDGKAALELKEYSGAIALNGKVTLIEDSYIWMEGKTENTVTLAKGIDGADYTLKVSGLTNTTISGDVNLNKLITTLEDADGNGGSKANKITFSGLTTRDSEQVAQSVHIGTLEARAKTTLANNGSTNVTIENGSLAGALTIAGSGTIEVTGTLETINSGTRSLEVQKDATLKVGTLNNSWGATYTINGLLEAQTVKLLSGSTDNLSGSGTIRTNKLIIGNHGHYHLAGLRMEIGSGGIVEEKDNAYSIHFGDVTIAATESWNIGSDTNNNIDSIFLKNAATGTNFEIADKKTVSIASVLKDEDNSTKGKLVKSGTGTLNLQGANTYSGGTTINAGSIVVGNDEALGTGMVKLVDGSLEINENRTLGITIDMANQNDYKGQINIAAGKKLTLTNTLWLGSNSSINLASGAELTKGNISVIGTGATSTVKRLTTGTDNKYLAESTNHVISNAIARNTTAGNVTYSNVMDSVTVENMAENSTLKLTNGYNVYTGIKAEKGDIHVQGFGREGLSTSIEELVIGAGRTVGIQTDWQNGDNAINSTSNIATVTVTKSAKFEANSRLNANLTLNDGATLTINNQNNSTAAVIEGTLTLLNTDKGITLAGTVLDTLAGLQAPGSGEVILFSGVDTLVMAGTEYNVGEDALTAASGVKLSEVFSSNSVDLEDYYIGFNANGDVYAGLIVPEPTTATLSLLALAGLCARRRRK